MLYAEGRSGERRKRVILALTCITESKIAPKVPLVHVNLPLSKHNALELFHSRLCKAELFVSCLQQAVVFQPAIHQISGNLQIALVQDDYPLLSYIRLRDLTLFVFPQNLLHEVNEDEVV
jgi:hypothetical protein